MDFTSLKNCMNKIVEEYHAPGVDCIVYRNHEMIFRYFTGMRDIENNIKMDGDELYLIYSMTKMITCTAALQLFEQGKYQMTDPVAKFLPAFTKMKITTEERETGNAASITTGGSMGECAQKNLDGYAQNPITIKDLFTMSAGLDYALKDDVMLKALAEGKTGTMDLVNAMAEKTLDFEPGTRFQYSLCHDVLGALIEVWSGHTLGEYTKGHIFEPLQMTSTFFGVPTEEKHLKRMAARYIYDENRMPKRLPLENMYILSSTYESGGAGLTSCTEDYALFLDALACGGVGKNGARILSSKTVEFMKTNQLKGKQSEDFDQLRTGYGYGLGVRTHIDPKTSGSLSPVGEFGWDGAAGGFSMVDTQNNISLTYFQHVHNWEVKIQNEIRNALYTDLNQ